MFWDIVWKNKTSLSLGFCISFSLICIFWQRNPFSQVLGNVGRLADRLSGFLNSGLHLTDSIFVEIDKYRSLEQKFNQSKLLIEKYRLEKDKFDELQRQNKYLREALNLNPLTQYPEIKAEVLGVRVNLLSPRIIISKGKKDGIKPLMGVIAPTYDFENNIIRGVVGVVVVADANTSVVKPLIHPNFELGVRIEKSNEWAILSGNSGVANEAILTYINKNFSPEQSIVTQAEIPLSKNAQVFTSGASGIFPAGIPVGVIIGMGQRRNDFLTAYVKPYVQINEMDYVIVILKEIEPWSQNWEKEQKWEDQLKTEFPKPEYPDIEEQTIKAQAKQKQKQLLKLSKQEKENKNTKTNQNQNEINVQPRRLQNLSP